MKRASGDDEPKGAPHGDDAAVTTRTWVYAGAADDASAWRAETRTLPPLRDGDLLVECVMVSVDPYLKIQTSSKPTWQEPYAVNTPQRSFAVARVLRSRARGVERGALVRCYAGWTEREVVAASDVDVLDAERVARVGVAQHLAALGMVGRTAYHGCHTALAPLTAGETALVTGAAGAVGSLVVQLLKRAGLRVVATAGTDAKCALLRDKLGADVALNYKTTPISHEHTDALRAAAPEGIDVFFDNVGGDAFDAAIQLMNTHARIAICGQISQYHGLDKPPLAPRFLHHLIYKRIKIQGILQRDCSPEHSAEHQRLFVELLEQGTLHAPVTVRDGGFDAIPAAQLALFTGDNVGKLLVRMVDDVA